MLRLEKSRSGRDSSKKERLFRGERGLSFGKEEGDRLGVQVGMYRTEKSGNKWGAQAMIKKILRERGKKRCVAILDKQTKAL